MVKYVAVLIFLFLAFPVLGAVEDLTTWTESDPQSKLTVTASKVTYTGISRDENDTYLVRDANFSDGFDIDYEFKVTDVGADDSNTMVSLADALGDLTDIDTLNGSGVFLAIDDGPPLGVMVVEIDAGSKYWGTKFNISDNTLYYVSFTKEDATNSVTAELYSDASRETLVGTATSTLHNSHSYDYLYGVIGHNLEGVTAMTGYVENINVISGEGSQQGTTTPATSTNFSAWLDESGNYILYFLALFPFLYFLKFVILLGKEWTAVWRSKHI